MNNKDITIRYQSRINKESVAKDNLAKEHIMSITFAYSEHLAFTFHRAFEFEHRLRELGYIIHKGVATQSVPHLLKESVKRGQLLMITDNTGWCKAVVETVYDEFFIIRRKLPNGKMGTRNRYYFDQLNKDKSREKLEFLTREGRPIYSRKTIFGRYNFKEASWEDSIEFIWEEN